MSSAKTDAMNEWSAKWFQFILDHPDKPWNWFGLSQNPNITWDIVQRNPDKKWNWDGLSGNPNITWDIVQKNADKPWSWKGLLRNPNITWDIVQKNPNKKWNWFELSYNPNITWDIVQKNPDKPWNWCPLSQNPNITWDIVQKNTGKPWDWFGLSRNPNITWDIVQKNPNKPWNWDGLSENPNITWDIVQKNPDKKWDWRNLSENKMTKAREAFINEKLNSKSVESSSQQIQSESYSKSPSQNQTKQTTKMSSAKSNSYGVIDLTKDAVQNKPSITPVDNINLCFVGGVSTGKSTILNAIFCEELTQCKIKRTTMVPTIYIENENNAPNLDNPAVIFDTIAKKNKDIIEKTESAATVEDNEYAELVFNVGKLDINILPDSYVNVYDIPGLNDARTKSVYYKYLQTNFFRFNLIVFIVDIHSGLNTSDEADILHFIADHTKHQLTTNNKKIYTLVVVNKADDMQLVPDSVDDELEITGELGDMFEQVQNTVTEAFQLREISEHLVGIIPLCAIDSYLYRMTQKHGSKFKLSPEQILKIGINENGKRFSKLKPATQETKVREILNDKEFVDTMIKLSGFGHFEKLLHSFLSKNNTGKQIRIDNLLYELRKLEPLQIYTETHLRALDSVVELLEKHFRIFRAIEKIDTDVGNALVAGAKHDMIDTLQSHITNRMKIQNTINQMETIVAFYDIFRDKILTPYFATEEKYSESMRTTAVANLVDILHTSQLKPADIHMAIRICEKIDILTATTFEKLNNAIVENANRFSTFIDDFRAKKHDDELYIRYVAIGKDLGVDMTIFLRFVILSKLYYKSYYSDKELFQKLMIYKAYDDIPIYTYLQHITAKISNPSPEWFLYGAEMDQDAHQLDIYYLKNAQVSNKYNAV